MAITNEAINNTNKKLISALKDFVAALSRERHTTILSKGGSSPGISLAKAESTLSSILTQLENLNTETTLQGTSLDTIKVIDFSTENTLGDVDAKLTFGGTSITERIKAIQDEVKSQTSGGSDNLHTLLDDINTKLQQIINDTTVLPNMDSLLATIDSDTNEIGNNTDGLETAQDLTNSHLTSLITNTAAILDDTKDLQSELESIDDNWNILSVNNVALLAADVALAAILVAVLNNATSGRQDTMNNHLDQIQDDTTDHLSEAILSGGVRTSGASDTLIMTTSDLTKVWSIGATDIVRCIVITMTGEVTASRDVVVNVRIGGSSSHKLTTITIASGTIVIDFDDAKWDKVRLVITQANYTSNCELEFIASAVTATEQIRVRIASMKVKD